MTGNLVFITGATGHVGFAVLVATLQAGYAVRASVRREAQGEQLKSHPKIQPYAAKLEFVTVPDITKEGAFDNVLDDVVYIQHIASPLAKPTEDLKNNIIEPAIHGTTAILRSALKNRSIRRVIITSSLVAITPGIALTQGDLENVYSVHSRVKPLPTGPWSDLWSAYRESKVLALDATERFIAEKSPHFSVVNIMPGYVIGANDLVTDAKEIANGSNGIVMAIITGQQSSDPRPCSLIGLSDVVRAHVGSLDEEKVEGSKSFLLDSGRDSFDEINEIVRKAFPDAVASGKLPLGGSIVPAILRFNVEDSERTFGPLASFERDLLSVVDQFLKTS